MQPTPTVTDADVARIVRREFAATEVGEALALLETYGTEGWHREAPRVRAAILKLAGGDLKRLRQELEVAKRDYRDVLVGAEYLAYGALTLRNPQATAEEVQRAINADAAQYQEWLRR